jgi:hypothetical protein
MEAPTIMSKQQMSSRLSPQAKKLVLRGGDEIVTGMAEVAPTANLEQIRKAVEQHGGHLRPAAAGSGMVTFEICARDLSALAEVEGVVYVTTAETYRT